MNIGVASEEHAPAARRHSAGQASQQSGFAGAIRPDDRGHGSGPYLDGDIVEDGSDAITGGEPDGLQRSYPLS